MDKKYVYFFGGGQSEGKASMKDLLGGKGANLAEMASIGVPVPPGFTITTEVCEYYYANGLKYPEGLDAEIDLNITKLEQTMGAQLGGKENPLLVSVRSGAAVSMPGMMDTVLNLGINDEAVVALAKKTNNERMAWDSYRRFINMFGDVCMGVDHHDFEKELTRIKKKYKRNLDTDLTANELKEVVDAYKAVYKKQIGKGFPTNAREQLTHAINAVVKSWNIPRAVTYRRINKMVGYKGTAVNVQAMAFGNMGDSSGTGVAFTRNPANGDNEFYGEYLINAQGEDVVAGIRTPDPISTLKKKMPDIYKELDDIRLKLEQHYRNMQDVEFTIQEGKLFMLQTRNGKRTGLAAVKIAVDMVQSKMITPQEGLMRIDGDQLNQLLFPIFDLKVKAAAIAKKQCVAKGLPAGPGAASGQVVFTADDAVKWAGKGKKVILVRQDTSPEDVSGMWAAEAILTSTGGMTSHAAVVARGWGKCCVAGCGALDISCSSKTIKVDGRTIKEGDFISIDGTTGEVILGSIQTSASPVVSGIVDGNKTALKHPICKMFLEVMKWADAERKINVRTNADSPKDAACARAFGAEGIGLTRTEHMFFEGDRIWAIREMILASDLAGREAALKKLLPYQRKDFEGIFKAMNGFPVTIRLLDPPLHEFLPHDAAGQKEMAKRLNTTPAKVKAKVDSLHEFNPMLGHRGCRLSITFPEICKMQTRAIIEAACNVASKDVKVLPEIMIPLIGTKEEYDILEVIVRETADAIIKAKQSKIKYMVGTMMEIPRATLVADKVAEKAEFFSFGTNDLTQMTLGFSRDDIGTFLPDYIEKKIFMDDPFASIDQTGVGELVKIGVERGRATRPNLKIGVCGEHGGDPASVKFFARVGLNYVSCSPFRVPIARLAAAQAALEQKK
ncbi:MAG: pyruvate, phosphate dikinase [Omnitrophica WOR_2 bacterium GWF2_38_59]|nr:MAG: pyruvate, phosphate dikinase [Omnitrophica WOR_2 bacterium GWA2_37_7]OGX24778.1 MAG: pyruvate, phosphate dikinase [Omnitrophica WOR_2 bacterium GWF2_38_59]OGX51088.1 MAG: pyruvate, phosphate dikinase [Omnitrophica WOR_2 bacterium RIFOXYA2_FULL_38_17]OGX56152.1 MAG: pyruvate, phosphate dikinase [Omnitrophica WOR_2 bacterium RIFOXYC2_FULL_38_12]OGX60412.1 MAG: pyruvate, phosphate dikinase [Omnitrophica WOR_2 bacterium RIFOXYB2_FULL_38_16]HBG60916.1 pyruvate, phosphate dikinase [Candidatu